MPSPVGPRHQGQSVGATWIGPAFDFGAPSAAEAAEPNDTIESVRKSRLVYRNMDKITFNLRSIGTAVYDPGNERSRYLTQADPSAVGTDRTAIGLRWRALRGDAMLLRNQLVDQLAVHVGEAKVAPRVAVRQLFVVEAQKIQECRVQVMHVNFVFNG